MILRLQTEEELTALQQKLKAKLPSRMVHSTEPVITTGTDAAIAHLASLVPLATHFKAPDDILAEINAGNTSRKPHKGPTARKPVNWSSRLQGQCKAVKMPIPSLEYVFHPVRRWRFDCAWIESRVAVEIEGGLWINGRHNRAAGFLADMSKYNEATKLGWRIYRFSPSQIKKGTALQFLCKLDL